MKPRLFQSVKSFRWLSDALRHASGRPTLITVSGEDHAKPLQGLTEPLAGCGIRHEGWSYRRLFSTRRLPRATYILTDFDRLLPWHIELAGRLYCRLSSEGLKVLNDPRAFVPRWALLRQLHRAGINDFDCWLPAAGERPERFPAFLRTIHAHRGVESDLLHDASEAEAALQDALDRGRVLSDLVFVEFAAEPARVSGMFRKHACYGIGGEMIRALSVTESSWVAKAGTLGAASDADYSADLAAHRNDIHAPLMKRVFDLAGMDFGRVDYGIVGERPQIYELNTNPTIRWRGGHPNADRSAAETLLRKSVVEALADLVPSEPGPHINAADVISTWRRRSRTFGQP